MTHNRLSAAHDNSESAEPRQIVIVGPGGFGREVLALLRDLPGYRVLGWLDDDSSRHGETVSGLPVLGDTNWLRDNPETWVTVAVGNPATRRAVVGKLLAFGHAQFATLIHPSAWIGPQVEIGIGVVICAGNLITTDLSIGNFSILNLGCTVGHDSNIGEFCTLAPGVHISGSVHLGQGADMGTGSVVIQGMSVGADTVVGAGAVVVRDLPAGVTAVGMPAKPLQR